MGGPTTPDPEESMMEVVAGGLTFRLRTWGSPASPPLLLIGHVPDVSFSLDGLATALLATRTKRRVLVPDRIDLGTDAHFGAIAADLGRMIRALDCGRLDMVGVGFGGTVAIYLATSEP